MMLMRDFLRRCAETRSSKVAYIDGDTRATWADLYQRSGKLASALTTLGVRKGDTVAILAFDHLEVVEHFFACAQIGAVRVGINRGYSAKEMAHVVRDSNAKAVIVQNKCCGLIGEFLPQFREESRILIGFGDKHGLDCDYEKLLTSAIAPASLPEIQDDDPIAISYTSGTTGYPKGVIFRQRGVLDMSTYFTQAVGLRQEDVWLNPTSMAWATIILNVMSVVNGMTTVLQGSDFKADNFLGLCSRHKVTSIVVVPVMLQRLLASLETDKSRFDLSSLRLVSYGSAPASTSLIRSAIDTLGVQMVQLYGLTECGAWATYLSHEDHLLALAGREEILKSCGKAWLNCDVSIRNEEGEPVPHGEMGELWIRSSTRMLGYHNLPELTAQSFHGEWLRTHDIGRQDAEGYIYLTDRKHFLIITGAANVFPSIVENTIAAHPAVREVAVVGAPHPEWGEAVVAMVALREGREATSAEIIEHCQGKIAKWEVPKFIEIVSDLPKGPTLKILKNQIRDRYRNSPSLLPWVMP